VLPMRGRQPLAISFRKALEVIRPVGHDLRRGRRPARPRQPNLGILLVEALRLAMHRTETPHPHASVVRYKHSVEKRIRLVRPPLPFREAVRGTPCACTPRSCKRESPILAIDAV